MSRWYESTDDLHYQAYLAVARALRCGILTRPTNCERCDTVDPSLDGHHHNGYEDDHALDVVWLCRSCHTVVHHDLDDRGHRGGTARWADISPEDRSEIQKNLWAGLSEEQRERQKQGLRDAWAKLTADERRERNAGNVEAARVKYTGTQRSSDMKEVWARLTPEQRKARAVAPTKQGKCECGLIRTRGVVARHAKALGHTWEKI